MSDQPQNQPPTDSGKPPADGNQPPAGGGGEDKTVKIGNYNVKVVRSGCIGAATCVAVAPGVFELDKENIAVILDGANDTPENIVASAQGCPTKAIIVTDATTGEQVWPK